MVLIKGEAREQAGARGGAKGGHCPQHEPWSRCCPRAVHSSSPVTLHCQGKSGTQGVVGAQGAVGTQMVVGGDPASSRA